MGGSGIRPKNSATFKRRKEGIKKKTMELSVLCGIKAAAIIIGPDGKLETWPENCEEVLDLIQRYQNFGGMKSGNEVASPTIAGYDNELCLPNTASYQFEADVGLAAYAFNEEEFQAKIQELPSTLTAAAPTHEPELDQEIEGWMKWECFDPTLPEVQELPTSNAQEEELGILAQEIEGWMNCECFDPTLAEVQKLPSTSNAQEGELGQEIERRMNWECSHSSHVEFDEWMNVNWDCSAF